MTLFRPQIADEVRDALAAHRPVLALESTIFTHGLPRPRNVEVALAAEQQVRDLGVTPATIGLFAGQPTIGLSTAQIEQLGNDDTVVKASVRDLPIAAAAGQSAGTTVAATSHLARLAGIRTFSTGGLGGVHRGAAATFDESADLYSLANLPTIIVSAGVKSILDVGLTLERLESLSIGVVGYGTIDFPGFYVADSGFDIDHRVDTAEEIAAIARWRDALAIDGALLVANPIAADRQLDQAVLDDALAAAEQAAADAGVAGHDTTPFLLDHIQRSTDGASLDVNVEVYRGNVALGAAIAAALTTR